MKYFKKAIDLNPNFSKAFKQLGYTLEELEKYEEAIEYLERVGSDDRFVSQHIQNCYSKLGQSINKHVETEDYNSDSQKNPNDKYENKLSFDSRSNDSISASSILELDNEELNNELNINFHEDYNEVDYLSKIKQAKELLDDGAITQEEYNILKRKFLDLMAMLKSFFKF